MKLTPTYIRSAICNIVSYTYPIIILDISPSTFVNKVFNCVHIALSTCHVQGSFLIIQKQIKIDCNFANILSNTKIH